MLQARILRKSDDVREQVAALARLVYPYYDPYDEWWGAVCSLSGCPVSTQVGFFPGESTLSQLYAVQAALMSELQKMVVQTELLLEERLPS